MNTRVSEMNSITATYPGFQALPKGIKQMLVVSESLFFEESKTSARVSGRGGRPHEAAEPESASSSPAWAVVEPPAIAPWAVPAVAPASAAGLVGPSRQ